MLMRLAEKESLSHLKENGFEISANHLYRLKRQIGESRFDRLSLIAKQGFIDQHLERIDQLELINREYWNRNIWIKKASGIGATESILRFLTWKILVNSDLEYKSIFIVWQLTQNMTSC